ncbi:hypothetical protein D3C76_897650 [compost metagenome]
MLIFAQVEQKKLVQFVAFSQQEVAQVHFAAFPLATFIQTDQFGSPSTHRYNATTGKIEPIPQAG